MGLEGVEVRTLGLALRDQVVTAVGVHQARPVVFVQVVCGEGEGWGEVGSLADGTSVDPPLSEVVSELSGPALQQFFAVARANGGELPGPEAVARVGGGAVERVTGAALEMAVLDCSLRQSRRPLAQWLGADGSAVGAGAVVGIPADREVGTLLASVDAAVARGYRRVRLKIEPGWDVMPIGEVRRAYPDLHLQADANASYRLGADGDRRAERLVALDEFALGCLEQPLAPDDLASHAELAAQLGTPICLDESLTTTARLAEAIDRGACRVACLKPARLGGLLATRRAVDLCRDAGVAAFVGGFFETGLGRSANAALAGLPGFGVPGDLSDPSEYLEENPVAYPRPVGGRVSPPEEPGVAPVPDPEVLGRKTVATRWFAATG